MVVSGDAPSLDIAYKLVEYAGTPRIKTSANKVTLPGRKQVFRAANATGGFYADLIALAGEAGSAVAREFKPPPVETVELLYKAISSGQRVGPRPTLTEARERLLDALGRLESRYKDLEQPQAYPVKLTTALNALTTNERIRAEKRQG
jgi:nicotinate phosphoribosyltransferase